MKYLKNLLILGFCFALIMTTTVITDDYAVSPTSNFFEDMLPNEG